MATMNQAPKQGAQQGIEQQVVQLVQAAVKGDQKATQQIEQIMQAAQQGNQEAIQIAQVIQKVVQAMQAKQGVKAQLGAKLDYINKLKGNCPNGQETYYFQDGGQVKKGCKPCMEKAKEGKKLEEKKKNVVSDFKEKRRMKADLISSEKCGGKAKKAKKHFFGGPAEPLKQQSETKEINWDDLDMDHGMRARQITKDWKMDSRTLDGYIKYGIENASDSRKYRKLFKKDPNLAIQEAIRNQTGNNEELYNLTMERYNTPGYKVLDIPTYYDEDGKELMLPAVYNRTQKNIPVYDEYGKEITNWKGVYHY